MKKISILIALVSVLLGCATPNIEKDYSLEKNPSMGVVVGSITYQGPYSAYIVGYRQLPDGEAGQFQTGQSQMLIPYFPKKDFSEDDAEGDLFVAALPAGKYEIYWWRFNGGAAHISSEEPFKIEFTVVPGKFVYVGNFQFAISRKIGLVAGATVTYKDMSERDLPKFKQKYPKFAGAPISAAVEKGANFPNLGGESTANYTIPLIIPVQ